MDVELSDDSARYYNNNLDNTDDDDKMDVQILCSETEPWKCVDCETHMLYTITNESLYGSFVQIVRNRSHTPNDGYMHVQYTELDRELRKRRLLFNGVTICKESDVVEVSRCGLNFVRVIEPNYIEIHLSKNPLVDNIAFLCASTISSSIDHCRFVLQPNIENMFAPLTASLITAIYLTHRSKFFEAYNTCFTYPELINMFEDNERFYTAVRDIRCDPFDKVRTTFEKMKEEAALTIDKSDTSDAIDTIIHTLNQATATKPVVLPPNKTESTEIDALFQAVNKALTSVHDLIDNLQTLDFEKNLNETEFLHKIQCEFNNFTEIKRTVTSYVHIDIRSTFEQYIDRKSIAIFDVLQYVNTTKSLAIDTYETEISGGRFSSSLKQHLIRFNKVKKAEESSGAALVEMVNNYKCPVTDAIDLKYEDFKMLYNLFYKDKYTFCKRYANQLVGTERQVHASTNNMFYFWQNIYSSSVNAPNEPSWDQLLSFVQNATLSRNDLDLQIAYELFPHDHVSDQNSTIDRILSTNVTKLFEGTRTDTSDLYWHIEKTLPNMVAQMNKLQKLYCCFTIGILCTVLEYDDMSTLSLYMPKIMKAADTNHSYVQNHTQLKRVCRECSEYSKEFLASINLESEQNHVLHCTISEFNIDTFRSYSTHVAATHRLWQLFADLWNKHLYIPYKKFEAERKCIDVFVNKLRSFIAFVKSVDEPQLFECIVYADKYLFCDKDTARTKALVVYELLVGKVSHSLLGKDHRYSTLQQFTEEDWLIFYDIVKKHQLLYSSDSSANASDIVCEQIVTTLLQEYADNTFVFSCWWSFIVDRICKNTTHIRDFLHKEHARKHIDLNATYTVKVQDSDQNVLLERNDFSPYNFSISTQEQHILQIYRDLGCCPKDIIVTLLQLPQRTFKQFRYLKILSGMHSAILPISGEYSESRIFVSSLLADSENDSGVDYLKLFILLFCFKNTGFQNILRSTDSISPHIIWQKKSTEPEASEGHKLVQILSGALFLNITTEPVRISESSSEFGQPGSCKIVPVWLLENFCCKDACSVTSDSSHEHNEHFLNTDIDRLFSKIKSVKSWSLSYICCLFLELKNHSTSHSLLLHKFYEIICNRYTFVLDRLSRFAVIVNEDCVNFTHGVETISPGIDYKHQDAAYLHIEKNSWTRSQRSCHTASEVKRDDSFEELCNSFSSLKLHEYDSRVSTQTYFDDTFDFNWDNDSIQLKSEEAHESLFAIFDAPELTELRQHLTTQVSVLPWDTDHSLLPLSEELSLSVNDSRKDSIDFELDDKICDQDSDNDFLTSQTDSISDYDDEDVELAVSENTEGIDTEKVENDDNTCSSASDVLENNQLRDDSLLLDTTTTVVQKEKQRITALGLSERKLSTRSSVFHISSHDVTRHLLALLERYDDIE